MNIFHVNTVWALLLALSISPLAGTVRAADTASSSPATAAAPVMLSLGPATASALAAEPATDPMWQSWSVTATSAMAQRGRYRGGRRSGRRGGGAGALIVGAAAAITGAAVLAYANRPDCDMNRQLSGCGYGTKVVGTAVLAGGMVGVFVGAALMR